MSAGALGIWQSMHSENMTPKYEKWQFDDLPILPQVWKLKVSRDKKIQFDVLKSLMNRADVDYLVNGCDAGREGELDLPESV